MIGRESKEVLAERVREDMEAIKKLSNRRHNFNRYLGNLMILVGTAMGVETFSNEFSYEDLAISAAITVAGIAYRRGASSMKRKNAEIYDELSSRLQEEILTGADR